jgi:hypothetical protein
VPRPLEFRQKRRNISGLAKQGVQVGSNFLRTNLHEMSGAAARIIKADMDQLRVPLISRIKAEVDVMIDDLIIDRFGLNKDFIDELGLTWIDNLETSSGKSLADPSHHDHNQDYVQNYIKQFGARKCEANALVVRPAEGRALCRAAITKYVAEDAPKVYRDSLRAPREELKNEMSIRFDLD